MRSFPPSHPFVGAAAVLTLALAPLACSSDDGGSVAQTGEAGDGTDGAWLVLAIRATGDRDELMGRRRRIEQDADGVG